jgi:tRNA U34 5-methylaminomethyl-2-thiouridine-forming methyltransferase MnmC
MIEVILTKDGSHTLLHTELNETYHSIHGAVQESLHVYIRHGLDFKIGQHFQEIAVLEIGFGTGLNAWLSTRRAIDSTCSISYRALEPFPLVESIWSVLNYAGDPADQDLFRKIHRANWDEFASITPGFRLLKINKGIREVALLTSTFDVVYFDAFAPEKQPDIWQVDVLEKVVAAMKTGGALVTYCAKGQVKRDLKRVGLTVETLPGPPGKREMVRGIKE